MQVTPTNCERCLKLGFERCLCHLPAYQVGRLQVLIEKFRKEGALTEQAAEVLEEQVEKLFESYQKEKRT